MIQEQLFPEPASSDEVDAFEAAAADREADRLARAAAIAAAQQQQNSTTTLPPPPPVVVDKRTSKRKPTSPVKMVATILLGVWVAMIFGGNLLGGCGGVMKSDDDKPGAHQQYLMERRGVVSD